jgi:hypothetical protein
MKTKAIGMQKQDWVDILTAEGNSASRDLKLKAKSVMAYTHMVFVCTGKPTGSQLQPTRGTTSKVGLN